MPSAYQIDHIFILVSKDAPEAKHLIDFGLKLGYTRTHHGQGTQNKCFIFDNMVLELIWVNDSEQVQNKTSLATTLWPPWQNRKSSSAFGLCIRSSGQSVHEPPFKAWKYHAKYFPASMFVYLANSVSRLTEPLIFYMPTNTQAQQQFNIELRNHASGLKQLTGITLKGLQNDASDAFTSLLENNIISLDSTLGNKIGLQFDGGKNNKVEDFSPHLPLMIKW